MTGEISLAGVVLPVGGIKEKVLGAKRAGMTEVILPADNETNVQEDLQPHMLEGLTLHYVRSIDEAIEIVFHASDAQAQKSSASGGEQPMAAKPATTPHVH